MEIICNQNEFNNAIQLVSKAVASRPTHPILANLLLTADQGNNMQNLLQRDLGSSLLSIAVVLGWLGLFFVFLRVLTISIKRILEVIFKKS